METISAPYSKTADPGKRTAVYAVIAATGLAFYLYYGLYTAVYAGFKSFGGDFTLCYLAARNFVDGRSIYLMPPGKDVYIYAPPVTLLFLPFLKFGEVTARALWGVVCQGLAGFCAWRVYRYGRGGNKMLSAACAAAAVLCSMPLCAMLHTGNVNILMFSGLALVYGALLSGRDKFVPALLAFFTALKIFPGVMAGLLIRRRDYRACAYFLLSLAGFAAVSLGVFGTENSLTFIRELPSFTRFSGLRHAMSLTFFVRLFRPGISMPALILANAVFLTALLVFWWKASAADHGGEAGPGTAVTDLFALTVILALVSPAAWVTYGAFFAIPFYFVVYSTLEGRRDFKAAWVFWLVFFLTGFWEIIQYQLPLSPSGLTMRRVWLERDLHPLLFPSVFSLHFLAGLALFWWVLLNYRALAENAERVAAGGSRPSGAGSAL